MLQERAPFPRSGRTWNDLRIEMAEKTKGDIDWRRGRVPLYVFHNDEDTHEIGRKAYFEFFTENALGGRRAFFGLHEMEQEVLGYGLDMLNAPSGAAGVFTNGGSESIFLAVKAARDAHRAKFGKDAGNLNVVMPVTAHPAFDKAANVMDLELRRAPVSSDRRADVNAMETLIDERTILLVGSAPCFPFGVVDPISDIGSLAVRKGIWLHVDACVGGWILPFFHRIGRAIPAFDFSIEGVRSISADLHKFGFCPKPASTVFYRDQADVERAKFTADAWPAGVFQTSTLAGTRPAGAVAAAWAVLNHLGTDGYQRAAGKLAAMADAYVEGISAFDELQFWAKPDLSIINFGSDVVDIYEVAEHISQLGWLPSLTRQPKGIHIMMSLFHAPVLDRYLGDLRVSLDAVRQSKGGASRISATY